MPLRRRTVLRIHTFAYFALTYGVVGVIWEYIEMGYVTLDGPLSGAVVGFSLAAMEETRIGRVTRSMPFTKAVVVKSIIYMSVLAVPVMISGFIGGALQGATLSDYFEWVTSADLPVTLLIIYPIHLCVSFVRHLNRLLGPKTLFRYLRGTYHRPRAERRIFMFLDMKSSTTLAETLGAHEYFSLLNTFFRDISEPILKSEAEIYQYVGDEVVLTWHVETGIRDANCVRVFFDILDEVANRSAYYESRFGHVPEFKAGLHFGEVITAEIGDLKKEIVYNGDVLNTASRIESVCNQFGQRLIASEELISQLELPDWIAAEALGPVELRGKADALQLVSLRLRADEPLQVQAE